jgi:hypothetical protein
MAFRSTFSQVRYDAPSPAALPSTYPVGFSHGAVSSGDGWPVSGTLMTVRRSNSRTVQQLTPADQLFAAVPTVWVRYGYTATGIDGWSGWERIGRPVLTNTGSLSERATTLPITTSAGTAPRVVLFSQALGAVRLGEQVVVLAEFQLTNPQTYVVGVGVVVLRAASATATTGTEITEATGRNITPDMHHDAIVKVGTHVPGSDLAEAWVNVVAYAYSTAALAGHVVDVDQDYGRLAVLRF